MVAHLLWEQRVAGSNPVTPTEKARTEAEGFEFLRAREGLSGAPKARSDHPGENFSVWSRARRSGVATVPPLLIAH